jgi:hypothetical protein
MFALIAECTQQRPADRPGIVDVGLRLKAMQQA